MEEDFVQYRIIDISEKERFNDFMKHHPKGHILQTWEWGEVKKGAWKPIRLIVEDEGVIVAAALLLCRQLPAHLGSFFYCSRGPVLDMENESAWQELLRGIKETGKKENALFCKFDPDIPDENELWHRRFREAGFENAARGEGFEGVQPRYVFRLNIAPSEEELLKNFHQKTRYNVRLAEKKGVVVDTDAPREKLPEFYNLLQTTAERDHFLIRSYSYFEGFYDILKASGMARMFMVYYEDKPISGALAFLLGDKAWYIYGASANEYRQLMPNYLMQWRMIQWAKSEGCTLYDFRGVPGLVPEDHPLYGLVKFKRGFGGDYVCFMGEYDMVFKPFMYRLYNFAEPLYQKLIRKVIWLKKKLKSR